ncbi:MAG: 5'/3'-nucleotidase SurE [bacterium]
MKKRILISNDDGIHAKGLKELYAALKGLGDITVIAPDEQRSGASHAITITAAIKVKKVKFEDTEAIMVKGTPADCVKLGLDVFMKKKPDLVISGINHGPNTASNMIYSGTIGAATEAAVLGIPAIAASVYSYVEETDFTYSKKIIREIAQRVLSGELRPARYGLLNLNIPYLPESKIKGVKVLPAGTYDYDDHYVVTKTESGTFYFLEGMDKTVGKNRNAKGMNDAEAIEKGYVTLTPLHFDLTDYDFLKKLKRIKI